MKFHTTLFTSLVALIFLVIVLFGTLVFHQVFEMKSVGELVSDYILAQVPNDGDFTITIGSIDSSLFTHITFRDIRVVENETKLVLTTQKLTIGIPAYRFLWKALIPKTIPLEIDGVKAHLDSSLFEKLSSKGQTSLSVPGKQIFVLQLTNLDLDIALDNWSASLEKGEASLTATSDSVIRGQLSGANISFFHPKGDFTSQYISLELGPTETNKQVIRLHAEENILSSDSFPLTSTIAILDASLVGDSLSALFKIEGSAALNATGFVLDSSLGKLSLKNLQTQATIKNNLLDDLTADFQSLEGTYGSWEGSLNSLQSVYQRLESGEIEIRATSLSSLEISNQQQMVGTLGQPQITYNQNTIIRSIRLGLNSLTLDEPRLVGHLLDLSLEELESIVAQRAHLLLIQNLKNGQINAETSFVFASKTTLPFLSTLGGAIAGDVTILDDRQVQKGVISFSNVTSSDVPGVAQGSVTYSNRGDIEGPILSGQLEHSSGILSSATYNLDSNQTRLSLRFNETLVDEFSPLITSILPSVGNLIAPQTTLEGNVNLIFALDGSTGRGTAEIGVANLAVDKQRFNVATTFSGSLDKEFLQVDLATITTEGLRLSYIGAIDRTRLFPEGILNISEVLSGDTLVAADFARVDEQVYTYKISSPKLQKTQLDGQVSWAENGFLSAQAILSVPRAAYPVTLLADIANGTITLDSDNFLAQFDLISEPGHITGALDLSAFVLPPTSGKIVQGQGFINGSIRVDIALAGGLFLLTGDNIELSGLTWGELPPWSLKFGFETDPQQLRINDILYEDSFGSYAGFFHLSNKELSSLVSRKFNNFTAQSQLENSTGSSIELSFFPDEHDESISMGSLGINQLHLDRFGLSSSGATLQSTLVGETNLQEITQAHAMVEVKFDTPSITQTKFELHIDKGQVTLERGSYSSGNLQISLPKAVFPFEGEASLHLDLIHLSDLTWRDGDTKASLDVTFTLPKASHFFEWASIPKKMPPLTISHSNTLLLGAIPWVSGSHLLTFENQILEIKPLQNGTITLKYDFNNGDLKFMATKGFPIPLQAFGKLHDQMISLQVKDIEFPMHHLNALLLEPTLDFMSGIIQGSVLIEGPLDNPNLFGTLKANSAEMSTFWTPEETFSLKNPIITISEHLASVSPSSVSAIHTSGRHSTAIIALEATFENWNIPHYRVDVLSISNPISLWLPLIPLDININMMVSGTFAIDGTPNDETLYGDIIASDGSISFGMPELPSWIVIRDRTSIDMSIQTGKNISFIYPNVDSPILRATFADNQRITLAVQAPGMTTSIGGELAFRSGEIYYVQKNFYITEGVLKFPSIMTNLTGELLPTLSLRARLREFELDGTRVDIYLVLQDSNLLDLNPRFESIPLRSTNEILELLGQNIVTAGTGRDSGFTSVVAIASAATDVVSRLGLLQTTTISLGFSTIIRDSLGLDVFTIRTNLLQNILFEALPGIVADTSVSPLARYLDNTTMYIGKYVLDQLYLQGMFHFRRDPLGKGASFLAEDLRIDTELSVEWTNPLATFSLFTQPEELSVFDLFDTMGFSITKRFDF